MRYNASEMMKLPANCPEAVAELVEKAIRVLDPGNLKQAFGQLESYLSEPAKTDRDRAGVIQAFEFTFEQFWKAFQKVAGAQGLEANSPRQALQAAFQIRLIESMEENVWLEMLKDRNLTSHVYHGATNLAI